MSGMKASLRGARLMALPSISGSLGASDLRPSWGRHASSGSARLFVAMQDIWVSLHPIRSRLTLFLWLHYWQFQDITTSTSTTTEDFFMRRTFLDPSRYPQILCIIDLRPLWGRHAYQGLLVVGSASLLVAMLGDLGASTLRSIKIMTQFSSLFWASVDGEFPST
jgi:hypothetical protein